MIRKDRRALRRSGRSCSNWAGPTATTCRSTTAGRATPVAFHRYAEELLALAPDVILASATPSVKALQQATRTVPIVFANVGDPVAMGFGDSLAHPGGNTTGFTPMEFGFAAKWLELLKE